MKALKYLILVIVYLCVGLFVYVQVSAKTPGL